MQWQKNQSVYIVHTYTTIQLVMLATVLITAFLRTLLPL